MGLSPENNDRSDTPFCRTGCTGNIFALLFVLLFISGLAQV